MKRLLWAYLDQLFGPLERWRDYRGGKWDRDPPDQPAEDWPTPIYHWHRTSN